MKNCQVFGALIPIRSEAIQPLKIWNFNICIGSGKRTDSVALFAIIQDTSKTDS